MNRIDSIGYYQLIRKFSEGTFGDVFLARDLRNNKPVAIKVIDITDWDANSLISIYDEINSMKDVSQFPNCSPYLVCFYDMMEFSLNVRNYIAIVMEYIEGKELFDYIRIRMQKKIISPPDEIYQQMLALVQGLKHIHEKGYAHRDIKPENIIINPANRQIKIIDFGFMCSKSCKSNSGSFYYISPEILNGTAPDSLQASQAHDIWSLGITFYLLANLTFPFNSSQSDIDIIQDITQSKLRPSIYSYPIYSAKIGIINRVINSMLNPDWEKRPTINQVITALK